MMTYKQWLLEHGKDSCRGCRYDNPWKARCNYRGKVCVRYEAYVREQKGDQQTLF